MFKNVASQKIIFIAYDATTGIPKTGDAANITAYVSKDGAAVTVLGDTSATEMDATNAKGAYLFDLTQGETNADMLLFSAKSSTANIYLDPSLIFTAPPAFNASVAQTGDSYAVVNSGTFGNSALKTLIDTLDDFVDTEVAAIKAKTDNLPATPAAVGSAMTLTSGERDSVADAILDRNMATGTDSGSTTVRTPRQAFRFLRNKWDVTGGTLTVKKEDDTTSSWTASVTGTAGADPITAVDPAGP